MRIFLLTLALCAAAAIAEHDHLDVDNPKVKQANVQKCLTEVGLDVSALGITKIEDLQPESLMKIYEFPIEKKNCFSACMYQRQGELTPDGKIKDKPSPADKRKFNDTYTFEDAINVCRAETDFCKRGGCLLEVYQ